MIDDKVKNRRLIDLAESSAIRCWRVDYEKLSVPERIFQAVWELEADINNGGFNQYFFNSSGRLAPFAAKALQAIGAARMAAIVDEAIAVVGREIPWADDRERQERVHGLSDADREKLSALDGRFFAYPDSLTALLYAYVLAHRDEIGAPPEF
jgi:hypothetical protein